MSEFEFWKDLGNIFDAILNYQKKNVEFNTRFINPWIRLGNVFERQDQHNEAVQAYQHAIEIDPDSAQNWINLGDAQFKNGTYDEAALSYQKAINLDPQSGWPLSNLAMVLVTQGKYEQAIPLYTASISLLAEDKDKAISWNRLGNVYRKLNDYENAFLAFQRADELDAENTGFNDKLDEAPPTMAIVAPEEILEQMIIEQQLEVSESLQAAEDAAIAENDTSQVEMQVLEEPVVALAPNMEMKIEEEEVSPIAEDDLVVVAPEEAAEPELEAPSGVEAAPEEPDEPKSSVLQLIEDVIAKVEAAAGLGEEKVAEPVQAEEIAEEEELAEPEAPRFPSWLIINNKTVIENAIAEGEQLLNDAKQKLENSQSDSVTTTSEVTQQVTISESSINMDIVETYTEPVITQLGEAPSSNDLPVEEVSTPASSNVEVVHIEVEEVFTKVEITLSEETVSPEETPEMSDEVEASEAAYEEYLKDVIEPSNILPDHVDEISETPLTKVSKDGEVRIAMDTKNAHVWNELGNVYLNAGSYEDAIAAYSKALELDRHFAWPYSNLALAYVQKGRFAEAILLYQRGIELFTSDKDKAVTWNRLGNVYRRMNDYDNAIAAYQTADELDPENATLSLRSNFGLLGNIQNEQKPAYIA